MLFYFIVLFIQHSSSIYLYAQLLLENEEDIQNKPLKSLQVMIVIVSKLLDLVSSEV